VLYYFSGFWQWVALTIGVILSGIGAFLLARWSWRWLITVLISMSAVIFLLYLPVRNPAHVFLDEATPPVFLNYFWTWMFIFSSGFILGLSSFISQLREPATLAVAGESTDEEAEQTADFEAAWNEIQLRFSNAHVDTSDQNVYLILTPEHSWATALILSAGIQIFAEGPEGDAPIKGFATADGVFLSLAGASLFGAQNASGSRLLEILCGKVLADRPDCPVVRGIVTLFPITWAGQQESVKWATSIREDIKTIERVLKIRCPIIALFTEMEMTPGFSEFVGRMTPAQRQSRCGFAVPLSHPFSGDLVQNGLIWMSGWFHGWTLSFFADDILNARGNSHLYLLDLEFRRYRKRLRSLLEAAFSTHREMEPMLFRGCYFTATGPQSNEQAFTAGLLRGARGRILADNVFTQWTKQAKEDDQFYRRVALVVGLVGFGATLLGWLAIIGFTLSPWWWAGPALLVVAWLVFLFWLTRKSSAAR